MASPEPPTLRSTWITVRSSSMIPMKPLHATIEEFAAEGRDATAPGMPCLERADPCPFITARS